VTAHQGVRVNSLTTGTPSHRFEEYRVDYVYRGSKKDEDDHPGPPPGSPKSRSARAGRMAVFAAARAQGKSVAEAGRAAGVTLTTAKTYRRELEQQGGSDD
jgi:hypothetical protein